MNHGLYRDPWTGRKSEGTDQRRVSVGPKIGTCLLKGLLRTQPFCSDSPEVGKIHLLT